MTRATEPVRSGPSPRSARAPTYGAELPTITGSSDPLSDLIEGQPSATELQQQLLQAFERTCAGAAQFGTSRRGSVAAEQRLDACGTSLATKASACSRRNVRSEPVAVVSLAERPRRPLHTAGVTPVPTSVHVGCDGQPLPFPPRPRDAPHSRATP